MKEKISQSKLTPYVIILIFAIIVSIPLLSKNLNIMEDDGIQHIARLIENYEEITKGNIYPEIFSRLCNNFGYSWNVFYGPITSFVPLIFKIFTNSFTVALKIFLFVTLYLSGITMYLFINELTKNKYMGIMGAIIYILAPYHLTDMYLRVALAEFTSFVFLPLVFLGLLNIINGDGKKDIILIIGTTGLILTHTVITIITAVFCLVYILINIKKVVEKTKLKKLLISLLFILGITAFFIIPLIEFKNSTTYEVFVKNRMGTVQSYNNSKIDLLKLIYTGDERLSFELGITVIIALILTPYTLKKLENKYKKEYILFLIFGIISLLMTLKLIPINIIGNFASIVQFAWRFLEFSTFFLSIIVAINLGTCILNFEIKDTLVLGTILVLSIFTLKSHLDYDLDIRIEQDLLKSIPVTENVKRVHPGCASFEYLPQKAFKNLDYIKTRKDEIFVLNGKVNINEYDKNIEKLTAKIEVKETSKLELPYIYYPGYTVKLQTETQKYELKTFETENGFVGVQIPENIEGNLEVKYTGTKLMQISKIISIITILILLMRQLGRV